VIAACPEARRPVTTTPRCPKCSAEVQYAEHGGMFVARCTRCGWEQGGTVSRLLPELYSPQAELNVAEIPYDDGTVRFRYARYLAPDGTRWVRHGLFRAFHPDGTLASEGHYEHGLESGVWRDYHANGQLAAEGTYSKGEKVGTWK
jgi:ribosomal protein S27AE